MLFHQQGEKRFPTRASLLISSRALALLALWPVTEWHPTASLRLGPVYMIPFMVPPQYSALSTAEGVANSNSWIGLRSWPGTS